MSATNDSSSGINWHWLHCDAPCDATFTVDYRYGHLARLREIAEQTGWSWAAKPPYEWGPQRTWDFCPRHSVTPIDAHTMWLNTAQRLTTKPGQEEQLPDKPTATRARDCARDIRAGRLAAFRPAGAYGARSSGTNVWAWYTGPNTASEQQ